MSENVWRPPSREEQNAIDLAMRPKENGLPFLFNVICMWAQDERGHEWEAQWRELLDAIDQCLVRNGYIGCMEGEFQNDPRLSQPKCHSCGGFVKVEEGGICLPCHTEGK
jgi:hypothetical protein